jgi:hypothetical protein
MSEKRGEMIGALKRVVVPRLKGRRFTGSFPHFRRIAESRVDLLSFQFDRWGGGFIIEVSQCPAEGFTTHWGEHIPPGKVTAHDLHPNDRLRLQPERGSSRQEWFRYDDGGFEAVAESVLPFIERAEQWWQQKVGGTPA